MQHKSLQEAYRAFVSVGRGLTASVVIRTNNDQRSLDAILRRVFEQHVAPLEVIVADTGSTDRTVAIADASDALVLTIAREERSLAGTLNRAARVARGDVLVLLSARCLPVDAHWLGHLLGHFGDPVVAAAWGPEIRPGAVPPPPSPASRQLAGSYTRETWTYGLSTDNGAVRTRLCRQEPFDESFPALEDKQWARVMMDRGYCVVYDPAANVRRGRREVQTAYRRRPLVRRALGLMFPVDGTEPPVATAGVSVDRAPSL